MKIYHIYILLLLYFISLAGMAFGKWNEKWIILMIPIGLTIICIAGCIIKKNTKG